jgi:hypothetical protein
VCAQGLVPWRWRLRERPFGEGEEVMEANAMTIRNGEGMPGHKVLLGDLEIAHDLQGDDLVLRVNKRGVLVFRAKLCEAAAAMLESRVAHFNAYAPDLMFTIGDSEEGLNRMLRAAGMLAEEELPSRGGFIRWLLGRA